MQHISLQATITLTEWSKSTITRRIADGTLKSATNNDGRCKTMICFESIKPYVCIPLGPDDIELIKNADIGDVNAQIDLAVLFLEHNKPQSAIYWLDLAVKQDSADAMHLLGRCYLEGNGLAKNYCLAIMWIAKAASLDHPIALAQIQSIQLI
jgi:TPR repeat protein